MVPLRFISESLKCSVVWDGTTKTVTITSGGAANTATLYDVVRVVDGDTIVVNYNGTEEKVRMIGIDTPESVHPDTDKNTEAGQTASEYTKTLLENKAVSLEFDVQERDQYGRLLAYVYLNGTMVNKTLLEDGYANIATYPPNVKYVDDFTAIVAARDNSDVTISDTTETTEQTDTTGTQYYRTNTGKRYHDDPTCNGGTYYPCTLEEAKASGLTPCDKCIE
ncbi:MAG: thermonuclease family protein [Firmicutes bacterium]|nr:thermonuclease family protein [Bacillota bacterium]